MLELWLFCFCFFSWMSTNFLFCINFDLIKNFGYKLKNSVEIMSLWIECDGLLFGRHWFNVYLKSNCIEQLCGHSVATSTVGNCSLSIELIHTEILQFAADSLMHFDLTIDVVYSDIQCPHRIPSVKMGDRSLLYPILLWTEWFLNEMKTPSSTLPIDKRFKWTCIWRADHLFIELEFLDHPKDPPRPTSKARNLWTNKRTLFLAQANAYLYAVILREELITN